jgi:hypothetical protein
MNTLEEGRTAEKAAVERRSKEQRLTFVNLLLVVRSKKQTAACYIG